MITLVLLSANRSPQPKWQIDWFSHFPLLMAACHWACLGMSFPLMIALCMGELGPISYMLTWVHASTQPK